MKEENTVFPKKGRKKGKRKNFQEKGGNTERHAFRENSFEEKSLLFQGKHIFTENLCPGIKVYGEKLLKIRGKEFRQWDPRRSKCAAALHSGLKKLPLEAGSSVLYLGAAEATTASHFSDLAGKEGIIFAVDVSARVMPKLIEVSEQRENIIPVLADANRPELYLKDLGNEKVDLLYQDVSQKNQAEIFLKNARLFLKPKGFGLLAIKARSISQKMGIHEIFRKELKKLEPEFKLLELVLLKPFHPEHAMAFLQRKS